MGRLCAVCGSKANNSAGSENSLFHLPKNNELRTYLLNSLGLSRLEANSENIRICEDHFGEGSVVQQGKRPNYQDLSLKIK